MIDPVFGIIKAVLAFTRFRLRGLAKVATGRIRIALAGNRRGLQPLRPVA